MERSALLVRLGVAFALMLPTPSLAEESPVGDLNKAIARIKQEAAVVVQTVIRDHVPDQARCIFTTEWSNRTVDMTLARQYLGSNLFADAVSPHTATRPSDFIDPTGKMPDHFCSNAEADALWKQRLAAFQSGDEAKSQSTISQLRVDIAVPVFDAKFETAVVAVSHWRQGASKLKRSMPEGSGYSFVYQKRDEGWVQVHETQDYTVN